MGGDLKGGIVGDWLVTGWFTPDYRPLAEVLAFNLSEHGAPFHLFAKPAGAGWNTRRKPSVVLEAMDAYPGKTVILMDVDCVVKGDISPIVASDADVGIVVIARNMQRRKGWAHWLALECSSRVAVFRPTEKARAFAQMWADTIERSEVVHDEHSMAWAYLQSPSVDFEYIPQAYSGREFDLLPDGVIVHDSAHERAKRQERGGFRDWLRRLERPFRTGRTRTGKLSGELSILVKA